jgi:glycosyltransferase involved in cell wall biosynthesis
LDPVSPRPEADRIEGDESLPEVSVIVIAKNEENSIGKCISSIVQQDYPRFEIVFVNSYSTDKTLAIVESVVAPLGRIKITQSHGNAAAARNAGLSLARGQIVAFVDGDSCFDRDWLPRAVRYLQHTRNAHVAAVGGPFIQVPKARTTMALAISGVESTMLGGGGSIRSHEENKCKLVRSLSLTGALFWSDVVRQVGFFDERLGYCEDSEFCQRVRLAGYRLMSYGDLGAFHTPKYETLGGFAAKMWKYGVGRGRAVRLHWRLMTGLALGSIAYSIVFATALFLGFVIVSPESKVIAILLAGLYLAAITASSLVISARQGSSHLFFPSLGGYLALHIPYTAGLMVGILVPNRQ